MEDKKQEKSEEKENHAAGKGKQKESVEKEKPASVEKDKLKN
tara:strand:+ start:42 stop:167 length:126 start_codon:yes stop_codon:yes gene_type:complete